MARRGTSQKPRPRSGSPRNSAPTTTKSSPSSATPRRRSRISGKERSCDLGICRFSLARSRTAAGLLVRVAGSWIDLDGRRHPCREDHTMGHLIDVDAHRYALRQAHPGEDRVDVGEPLPVGLRVCDVDAAGDAADMAANDLVIAHQLDAGRVAYLDRLEIGLLEIAVDPERVGVDERDLVLPDIGVVAELRQQVGHIAVDRRTDLSALAVDPGLVQIGESPLILSLRSPR